MAAGASWRGGRTSASQDMHLGTILLHSTCCRISTIYLQHIVRCGKWFGGCVVAQKTQHLTFATVQSSQREKAPLQLWVAGSGEEGEETAGNKSNEKAKKANIVFPHPMGCGASRQQGGPRFIHFN